MEERFPYTSPEDARTFTDAFVLVDAVDERIGELEGGTDDEGYRQRWVTFEVVEVLWARDGIDKVPTRFEEAVLGLAVHDGEDARLAVDGSPYVTVGEQYVLGMLTFDGALSIASTRSILPVGDGRIDVDLPEASNDRAKVAEGSDGATRLDYRAEVDGSSVMDAVELITGADPIVSDDVVDAEDRLEQWLAQSDSAPATTAAR